MEPVSQSAILRAIEVVKGKAALARAIGVTPQTVQQWANQQRPVPAERVLSIESATGGVVSRHELRPDIYPMENTAA